MNVSPLLTFVPLAALLLVRPSGAQGSGGFMTDGSGCPEVTSDSGPVAYGRMPTGAWSLDGSSLTFVSNGQVWNVEPGGSFITPSESATFISLFDDQLSSPLALPFTFTYPGGAGATTSIDVNSNGRVNLEAGTNPYDGGWFADQILPNFLSATPSICALGVDLNPGSGGTVTFEARTIGSDMVALVTWSNVPEYPSAGGNTFQCQLWSTGELVISHLETNGTNGLLEALVGVSAGGGSLDPGPSSLAVPLALSLSGQPLIGDSFSIDVSGVPLTATYAVLGVGSVALGVPTPLTTLGAPPGCALSIDQIFTQEPMTLAPPFASAQFDLGYLTSTVGFVAYCQAFVVDPAQAAVFPLLSSNRGAVTIGRPPDLAFIVEGANSLYGSPELKGFFRLESSPGATHADITRVVLSTVGTPLYFDTAGNAGVGAQGHFDDGNGTSPGSLDAYYGSDVVTGLVYGAVNQSPSCDGTGTTGWRGTLPVGGVANGYRRIVFDFADFAAGETFGFDCDTDGGDFHAAAHTLTYTVTFADATSITGTIQPISDERAEGVLIP